MYAAAHGFLARRSAELATKPCIWVLSQQPEEKIFKEVGDSINIAPLPERNFFRQES
jgi:hypothetical protein